MSPHWLRHWRRLPFTVRRFTGALADVSSCGVCEWRRFFAGIFGGGGLAPYRGGGVAVRGVAWAGGASGGLQQHRGGVWRDRQPSSYRQRAAAVKEEEEEGRERGHEPWQLSVAHVLWHMCLCQLVMWG